jgi:hypothetical protein
MEFNAVIMLKFAMANHTFKFILYILSLTAQRSVPRSSNIV